jgi:hypothetical protein
MGGMGWNKWTMSLEYAPLNDQLSRMVQTAGITSRFLNYF